MIFFYTDRYTGVCHYNVLIVQKSVHAHHSRILITNEFFLHFIISWL
jgi:hypothetical protein